MRWLIGLLFLANLLLFLWGGTRPDPDQRLAEPPPDVGQLTLLGEEETTPETVEGEIVVEIEPEPQPALPPEPRHKSKPPPEPVAKAQPTRSKTTPKVVATPPVPVAPEAPSDKADSLAANASSPARTARAPRSTAVELPDPVIVDEPPAPVGKGGIVCGQLRGFKDQDTAAALADRLREAGGSAELTETTGEEQTGYWVLVMPAPDRAIAHARVDTLEAAGIKDLWLVPAGPMKYAISLGLFSGSDRANRRADQIKALGLEAEVKPKFGEVTRYGIDYRADQRTAESVRAAAVADEVVTHAFVSCR